MNEYIDMAYVVVTSQSFSIMF